MVNRTLVRSSAVLLVSLMMLVACDARQPDGKAPSTAPSPRDSPAGSSGTQPSPGARPNILLILTDDQTADDMQAMPKTQERLARTGTVFRRAFSSYPLCCPARATVLTGQLAHNHGVMGNELPWGGVTLFNDEDTLPVWLRSVGYRTIFLGKYLNGYPMADDQRYVPPGWDEWHVPVDGIYNYRRYLVNDNGELNRYEGYQAEYVERRTSHLITQYARKKAPFFMWTGFLAPHGGLPEESDDPRTLVGPRAQDTPAVADAHRDSMRGRPLPSKPSINETDLTDKKGFTRDRPILAPAQLQEVYEQRQESLRSVDDAVAGILDTLERTGELDQTLVVFTSDNGFMVGEHRWVNKTMGYEESIRVPLLVSGPGVAQGVTASQVVSLGDITTTVLQVARAPANIVQDGVSLLALSQDPTLHAERSVLLESGGGPMRRVPRLYTGVRTADDMVLLRWWDGSEEVYDLKTDPYQLDGGVSAAEAGELPRLRRKLTVLADCAGAVCSSQ